MKIFFYLTAVITAVILSTQVAVAKVYEVPPSSSASSSVPVISDHAMEQCVILYNDAKDLKGK